MADLKQLSTKHDTSIEILQAIADQRGDDTDRIEEALDNPEDFDAIVARAREGRDDNAEPLRWQGRRVL